LRNKDPTKGVDTTKVEAKVVPRETATKEVESKSDSQAQRVSLFGSSSSDSKTTTKVEDKEPAQEVKDTASKRDQSS